MHHDQDRPEEKPVDPLWATLSVLGFGLALMAFLIAIDRPQWFSLRPASGTAAAMGLATAEPAPPR